MKRQCKICQTHLVWNQNWYPSCFNKKYYICIDCLRIKSKLWRNNKLEVIK